MDIHFEWIFIFHPRFLQRKSRIADPNREESNNMVCKILVAAAVVPLLAACAEFQASANEVTPQQTAAIEATCTKVMRLDKGQSEFEACVSSLSESVAYQVRADLAANAYHDCAQTGLKRETAEFSRCVLDHENIQRDSNQPAAGAATRLNAAYVQPADNDPSDYFETSFNTRHRREQYSCAELGLEPNTNPFISCVNNLDMDIFTIEHPPG